MNDETAVDPVELAARVNLLPRPWLIGVDVDGTLAPIVPRPEQARLAPDAARALDELTQRIGVMVAVVSGRPLADLREQFEIPSSVMLLGSHGAEIGSEVTERSADEQARIDTTVAALESVAGSLPGSWIEHKPLAVALHVRQADPVKASVALADLEATLGVDADLTLHRGHMVLEIAVRSTAKVDAFEQLRLRLEPATTMFIGDDHSDERVFGSLAAGDVAIKVGPGPTSAGQRLAEPEQVVAFLLTLARSAD